MQSLLSDFFYAPTRLHAMLLIGEKSISIAGMVLIFIGSATLQKSIALIEPNYIIMRMLAQTLWICRFPATITAMAIQNSG
jgi:hypothetical protein